MRRDSRMHQPVPAPFSPIALGALLLVLCMTEVDHSARWASWVARAGRMASQSFATVAIEAGRVSLSFEKEAQ